MKIKKLPICLFSLFLGFNVANAQNKNLETKQDTLKTYNLEEIIVNENNEEEKIKLEKYELKQNTLENSMFSGNSVKALELNPFIQRLAPNLISSFFVDGVSPDVLGAYYINNIPIMGSVWQQKGIGTILDSKLLNINVFNNFYSTKYDGLLSIINADIKSNLNKKPELEFSSNLFSRYIRTNFPVEEILLLGKINSSITLYLDNKEPLWFIKNNFPETKFLPLTKSYQFNGEFFDGAFNISAFKYLENSNVEDNIDNNNIKLKIE